MSFSTCSGPFHPGSVTRGAGDSRSPASAHTPVVSGHHPDASARPSPGRALARPPDVRESPAQMANPAHAALARGRAGAPPKLRSLPGRPLQVSLHRRADGLGGLRALLRAPIGWIGELPRSPPGIPRISHEMRPAAAEPPPCRAASSPRHTARSLGALPMSPARVHSRRVASPSAGRCHPTRRVPPSWFDPHLDGFLRAPTSRLLHLVPA